MANETGQNGQGQSPNEGVTASGPEGLMANEGNSEFSDFLKDAGAGSQDQQMGKPAGVPKKEAPAGGEVASTPVETQQPAPGQVPTGTPGTPETKSGIDPVLLEQIVSASVRGAQQPQGQQQRQPPKEMSTAEFNARYGITTVTPEHIAAILDQDPAKAATMLNSLLQTNQRGAVLMARDLFAAEMERARSEYQPHIDSWKAHQAAAKEQQLQDKLYKAYPDLVNEKDLVQEMTDAIRARVITGQLKFKTEAEVFQAVAGASRKLLARMNKQTSSVAPGLPTSQQGQQPQKRQMTAASTAGQSGTGQTAGQSDEAAVFGNDWR